MSPYLSEKYKDGTMLAFIFLLASTSINYAFEDESLENILNITAIIVITLLQPFARFTYESLLAKLPNTETKKKSVEEEAKTELEKSEKLLEKHSDDKSNDKVKHGLLELLSDTIKKLKKN